MVYCFCMDLDPQPSRAYDHVQLADWLKELREMRREREATTLERKAAMVRVLSSYRGSTEIAEPSSTC